jgi:hypothetical protein
MPQPLMYNGDVQQIHDLVQEYKVIASGTVATNIGVTSVLTSSIPRPTKMYKNYVLVTSNKTGQTINNVLPLGANNNGYVPNLPTTSNVSMGTVTYNVGNNAQNTVTLTPIMFALGNLMLQYGLAAATTATGTIDWVLIGY